MAADDVQSWVDQVQQAEQALIDIISRDGDLVVEVLSNIPPDARGRLQTMMVLAEEVVIQAAHGYHIVVDTCVAVFSVRLVVVVDDRKLGCVTLLQAQS